MGSTAKRQVEERFSKSMPGDHRNLDRLRAVTRLLPTDGRLLEIGVWDGLSMQCYRERFKGEAYGIDLSHKILDKAAHLFNEVKACDLDEEDIPFEDGFFDLVVCGEVIEHIRDTDGLILKIARVLRPEGCLIISTPNLASILNRVFICMGLQPLYTEVSSRKSTYGNRFRRDLVPPGHIRNFTYGAFKEIVEHNGFSIVRKTAVAASRYSLVNAIERLASSVAVSLGSIIILKCRKEDQGRKDLPRHVTE